MFEYLRLILLSKCIQLQQVAASDHEFVLQPLWEFLKISSATAVEFTDVQLVQGARGTTTTTLSGLWAGMKKYSKAD